MAWTYLAVSVETPLGSENMSRQSLIVKEIDTLSLSYYHECLTDYSNGRLSGTTSAHSLGNISTPPSTSSWGGSPAKISALLDMELAWKESEVVFFTKLCGWPKNSSPSSYSLKMCQQSEHGDWKELSKNLPKQAMTVDGVCYPLTIWVPRISEKDGFCLPTPKASSGGYNKSPGSESKIRPTLETMARHNMWPTPTMKANRDCLAERNRNSLALEPAVNHALGTLGGKLNPTWVEWLMGFPLEWTVLSDLVMPWYRARPEKLLKA